MVSYCSNCSCDLNKYLKPGLEGILGKPEQASYSNSSVGFYVPASGESKVLNYDDTDIMSYSVLNIKSAKDKVVQFLPHYDMPLRDWIRGRIEYGKIEGTQHVVINANQTADAAYETTLHEVEGHGADLGASEERVTDMNRKQVYDM